MIKERLIFKQIEAYFESPEAIVITGMRRTGKTTALNFFYGKSESSNKIILDLENPLNRRYFEEENYERIKSSFENLGLDFSKKAYLFLDEIQFVQNLPSVVKYFIDHYGVKFFLTGSASFYLKNLFTESLAGRKFIFEIFPLTFTEFLAFKESRLRLTDSSPDMSKPVFDNFANLYDEYIAFGGFPGVVIKTNIEEKKKALEEIFSSFFQLEILQLGDYRRNKAIRDLMLLLMQRVGSKLDIKKLSIELGITRPTIYEYLSFLEGTYFMKLVRPFSKARTSELRKIPKVYICDSGFANHFGKLDEGHIFENSIFQNLRMKGELNYYERKGGGEIDFILDKKIGFEIKLNPQEQNLTKLKTMAGWLSLEKSFLVSKKHCKMENVLYGFML